MRNPILGLLMMCFVLWLAAFAATHHRSRSVRREFQRLHPCPSTGLKYGSCPGYVVDHVVAIACGGADAVENMQWQAVADAKAKDKVERKDCGKKQ